MRILAELLNGFEKVPDLLDRQPGELPFIQADHLYVSDRVVEVDFVEPVQLVVDRIEVAQMVVE